MTPYEKCRRNHPAQQAADKRTLDRLESDLTTRRAKRERPRPRMLWRF